MKKVFKIIILILVTAMIAISSGFVGYRIGKHKEEVSEPQKEFVYMSFNTVKSVVNKAYASVTSSFDENENNSSNPENHIINNLKIAQKKDDLIVEKPQTDNDVLTEIDGFMVPTDSSYELNIKNALAGSLKFVQALVSNNISTLIDNTVTFQVRGAESAPENYDIKISLTGYINSIRIQVMISTTEGTIDNSIVLLSLNANNEITDCIYANKDVYAIYNAEADKSYYLDSSKEGASTMKTQINSILTDFEKSNSYIDLSTNIKDIL